MTNTPDLYLVKTDWWSKNALGTRHRHVTFLERDEAEMDRAKLIKDIFDGQVEDVSQVLCVNVEEGTCRDVTKDIAEEILNQFSASDGPVEMPREDLFDFLETNIGCYAMAEFSRQMKWRNYHDTIGNMIDAARMRKKYENI